MASSTSGIAVALGMIGVGCVVNNWVLELIVSAHTHAWADAGAGGMLTFIQFAFISVMTLDAVVRVHPELAMKGAFPLSLRPLRVPLRHYAAQCALFAVMSYLNNIAFKFGISQPTHMVFRSANLVVTCILGALLFGERYSLQQLGVIGMITVGAAASTLAEGRSVSSRASAPTPPLTHTHTQPCSTCDTAPNGAVPAASTPSGDATTWAIGIGILTTVLLLQSLLSHYQNWTNRVHGKAPREAMCISHTLSLPVFLLTIGDLQQRASMWSATPPTATVCADAAERAGWLGAPALQLVAVVAGPIPIMWLLVLLNAASQLLCVSGVYRLVSMTSALTVNVVLTVRKCVSLLLSIYLFSNPFTWVHAAGAALVFGGAFLYGLVPSPSARKAAAPNAVATPTTAAAVASTAGDTPTATRPHSGSTHQRTATQGLELAEGGFRHRHTPTAS